MKMNGQCLTRYCRQCPTNAARYQGNSGLMNGADEATLCADIAGMVAAMTEGEPGIVSLIQALGEPGQRSVAGKALGCLV